MSTLVDNVITARIIYLFVQPFEKWDAFKYGIIDKNGIILRKASSLRISAEKDSWSMLHRFVSRLKRMLATIPTGRSMLTSVAAVYMLIREGVTDETDGLEEMFAECYNSLLNNNDQQLMEAVIKVYEEEGGIANTTANIPAGPVIKVKRNVPKKLRRKLKPSTITNEHVIFIDSNGEYSAV